MDKHVKRMHCDFCSITCVGSRHRAPDNFLNQAVAGVSVGAKGVFLQKPVFSSLPSFYTTVFSEVIKLVQGKRKTSAHNQLDKMPNVLCCLLAAATQQECKFSSAGCWHENEINLRAMKSCNQLGNCFIWDIAIEDSTALHQSEM